MSDNTSKELDESRAWLRGERSHLNLMMDVESSPEDRQRTLAMTEEADAAATQRAYWIVKAHNEGLVR